MARTDDEILLSVSCSAFFRPVPAALAPAPAGLVRRNAALLPVKVVVVFLFFFLRVSDRTHDFTSYSIKQERLLTSCQVSQTQSLGADLI